MADCKIVNASMLKAVEAIGGSADEALGGLAQTYKVDGEDFIEALNTAIATMEGDTKDALADFFDKKVKPFVTEGLPNAVKSTAKLLEANRKNFDDVDHQIAESIRDGGK